MKTMIAMLLACAGLHVSSAALAETNFNGLTINETESSLTRKVEEMGLTIGWIELFPPFKNGVINKDDATCATYTFDGSELDRVQFRPCWFDAEDLTLEEFTQQFVNAYGGPAEKVMRSERPSCTDGDFWTWKGKTTEGERYEIKIDCGITVKLTKGSGKTPQF